jgi:hypothetical protein
MKLFRIPSGAAQIAEQLGSREKYWFMDSDSDARKLFKIGRPNTGEHWSEVVVARICAWLEIPHADYQLATDGIHVGVVTSSIVEQHEATRLIHGNEVLARALDSYPAEHAHPGARYNLQDVFSSLSQYTAIDDRSAVATFGDYLILDALVANQDRHHENWGLLELPDGLRVLAPTFDHAASLACRLTDKERETRLNTSDRGYHIAHYVQRAHTWLYETRESQRRLTTLSAAKEWAALLYGINYRSPVIDSLAGASEDTFTEMFDDLHRSGISDTAVRFAVTLLNLNRDRIITALQE